MTVPNLYSHYISIADTTNNAQSIQNTAYQNGGATAISLSCPEPFALVCGIHPTYGSLVYPAVVVTPEYMAFLSPGLGAPTLCPPSRLILGRWSVVLITSLVVLTASPLLPLVVIASGLTWSKVLSYRLVDSVDYGEEMRLFCEYLSATTGLSTLVELRYSSSQDEPGPETLEDILSDFPFGKDIMTTAGRIPNTKVGHYWELEPNRVGRFEAVY